MTAGAVQNAIQFLRHWLDVLVLDLIRQLRFSYLPPLMIYLAAGISGLTAIVGTFFVKEHFGFSASLLAGLSFWVGVPWTLKIPLGHLVDLVWRWKSALIYLGAGLIALSIGIMYGLIAHPARMASMMSAEAWYVVSVLLAPIGYVLQDTVADAMTAEAVPIFDEQGNRHSDEQMKSMHTTMQTLGRVAIISGFTAVAALNIWMFSGVAEMSDAAKASIYADIYLMALSVPAISIAGVVLAAIVRRARAAQLAGQGFSRAQISQMLDVHGDPPKPNWWIIGGGAGFAVFTLATGLAPIPFNQEIVFVGSMAIVLFLMRQLLAELPADERGVLIGTAIIIFVFRAVPLPGPGVGWWEIDVLGFDPQFLSVLSLLTSGLTLFGMLALRPLMARRSIAEVVLILTLASAVLALPNIGLFYGLHEWTGRLSNGLIDARTIAILDTALESPLGQLAMIPMLAWIAKNAPEHLKATFFAVMASFTNLALAASSLGTKYLNEIFVITREVRDRSSSVVLVPADYSLMGWLLIVTALLSTLLPILTIMAIQSSRLKTTQ
jgi:BT1 family